MRRALIRDGVRPQDVFTDHAGFDTWDSAQRARRIFGVRS
jgi:SanA protein